MCTCPLQAHSAPPTLADCLESAVPVPNSPAPAPTVQPMPAADIDDILVTTELPAAAAAVEVQLRSVAALLDSALTVPTSPLPAPTVQPTSAAVISSILAPTELAISAETVVVQPSPATALQVSRKVSEILPPAVPVMPAAVPSMQLAVPEHTNKVSRCSSHEILNVSHAYRLLQRHSWIVGCDDQHSS